MSSRNYLHFSLKFLDFDGHSFSKIWTVKKFFSYEIATKAVKLLSTVKKLCVNNSIAGINIAHYA